MIINVVQVPETWCPYCNGSGGPHDQAGGLVDGQCPECGHTATQSEPEK